MIDTLSFMQKYHNDILTIGKNSLNSPVREVLYTGWLVKSGYSCFYNRKTSEILTIIEFFKVVLGYSDEAAKKEYFIALKEFGDGTSTHNTRPTANTPQNIDNISKVYASEMPKPIKSAYKEIYGYLGSRGIPADFITELVNQKLIYEDEHKNLVFINKEQDYAESRGTNTLYEKTHCSIFEKCPNYSESNYKSCTLCSDCTNFKPKKFRKSYNKADNRFWYYKPSSVPTAIIYICEAAIDALSLYLLQPQKEACYISIGGTMKYTTVDRIINNSHGKEVILAVDNDEAGDKLAAKYSQLKRILPVSKDWNEDLISSLNAV